MGGREITIVRPDFKPRARIRDPQLLRQLHLEWKECVLCGSVGQSRPDSYNPENLVYVGLSLHHIVKHPRDDVRGNLVMLCGHGTAGCHGLVEARNPETLKALGRYVVDSRPDTMNYLSVSLGPFAAEDYLRRNLLV